MITLIFILISIQFGATIWLLIERDKMRKTITEYAKFHSTVYVSHKTVLNKHDKEIGKIFAKLENSDTHVENAEVESE